MSTERLDSERKPIEVGAPVAYNQSGDVVRGTVIEIKPTRGKKWHQFWFLVRNHKTGKISKVKQGRSMLVL